MMHPDDRRSGTTNLNEKRKQLQKSSRGIITLEVSDQLMLSDFSLESELHGDLKFRFQRVDGIPEPVGEPIARRNKRDFSRQTSCASAVEIQNRRVEGGRVILERKI
ncbi:MAG TPA: hypothetical protein VJN93_06560 [Candidatus Acidoferrum sp.]|nr:hypothetical protein [Candidatus Acidoferrum sp.]